MNEAREFFPLSTTAPLSISQTVEELEEAFFVRVSTLFEPSGEAFRLIKGAFVTAKIAHKGAFRDEPGVPYLTHPVETALILIEEFGVLDHSVIALALLHDALEENRSLSFSLLELLFPQSIIGGLKVLTRPEAVWTEDANIAYHYRFLDAERMVVLVKLADRLHNMRTLEHITDRSRQARIVRDNETFYLPLARAHSVGVHEMETEITKAKTRLGLV